jgi:uncharacterized protein YceK
VHRALLVVVVLLALAGCGGVATDQNPGHAAGHGVAGLGLALDPPQGWSARILIGAEGRPILHAASFSLSPNDDDTGEVARETIGGAGQMYVNVRDLGPGETASRLPVRFDRSDFGPPPPGPGSRCCFITVANRDVAASGHVYRVTVTSGSDELPSASELATVNGILSTLALKPYESRRPTPIQAGEQLAGYGIDLTLPPGWHGRISSGVLEAASFDLSQDAAASGPPPLGRGDVAFRLVEHGGSDAPFITARLPLQLAPTEFIAPALGSGEQVPALTGRSFVASGRQFVLWASAGSLPPSATELAEANEALATLRIEPGDFYPGTVEPATFAAALGWHTGTSGPAEVEPGGEQTSSWASTVPYRDPPNQFPPHETLDALPPDGIAIVAWLSRHPGSRSELPTRQPPFDLAQAHEGPFEGVSSDRATYQLLAHVPGRYDVTLWIFFGRPQPTNGQLTSAQAEVDRLRLPSR